jgi:tetratricopeptide (TPR) repeat protein
MELRPVVKQRLRSARNWPSLIEELEREVEKVEAKEARAAALFELGEVCEDVFLRKDRAMVHYQAAFKLNPQDTKALDRARRIYREMGNLEMVATLLGLELKVTQDAKKRAEVQGRLGIAQLDLGQLDKALSNLEAAHDALPDDQEIADAYAAASYDKDEWIDAADRLTKQAAKQEPATAARIFLRVARIYQVEMPGDPQYAEALRKVLGNDPQHETANFLFEGFLAAAGRQDDIVQLHEARARLAVDDKTRTALYRRFASTWALRFNDLERSALFYRKALEAYYGNGVEQFPGHLAAFGFLREIHGARGEWDKLLALADLGMKSKISDDELAILATQAGVISWKEMKDAEKAKGYFRTVKKVYPESEELRDFTTAVGDVDGAAQVAAAGGAAVEVMASSEAETRKITPPSMSAPATPVSAPAPVAAVAAPVAATPAPAPVAAAPENLSDDVKKAMDAAKAAEANGVDKGIEAWRKVIAANAGLKAPRAELARVYRTAERWNALVELYKEQAEKLAIYSQDEKVAVMFELVDIYREKLKLDVMVINTYNAILAAQPGNGKALEALANQYEHMKRWPDLISTLQKKAGLTSDTGEQIQIFSRIANLFQEKFSNAAEAIKAYEKVLELDPQNGAAIAFLKVNYEKRRDWEKLIAVHQREIERIADEKERGVQFIAVAKLASEKLKKPSVSIELWAKVLGVVPDHAEALAELEKLYEREKMWDKLAEVCERQAAALSDPAKKVAMLQKLGILFTDKVNEPARAVAAWKAMLAVEPENKRAQDALKKLYLTQKNWTDLEAFYAAQGKYDEYIRVLERQVETEDDATKIALNTRIAELYRDQLNKADRALRAYEKVLTLDARNLAAAEALIPLYEGAKDPKKLAGALEIQLEHTKDPRVRIERMRRLVELFEGQLRDKAAAYGWCLRAFAENQDEQWTRLDGERLAKETGAWQELVNAYETAYGKLLSSGDQAKALPLALVVARVYEEELGEPQKALETNKKIIAIDENSAPAIAALERLYVATQQFPELLSIYEKKLALESDPSAQKEIRYKIASLFEEEIKDNQRAIDAYGAILAEMGDELPALRALDRIFTHTERWKELAQIIPRELMLTDVGDVAATVDAKFRLGTIREKHLGDLKGAIECFRDILELDGTHAGARASLEGRLKDEAHQLEAAGILEPIYERLEEWPRLIEVHEIQLGREKDNLRRTTLLSRIGELWAQKIGDGEKAFEAYSRCFKEDPSNATARGELERLAAILEGWAKVVALYEAAIEGKGQPLDASLQRELLLKVAEAYDDKLGEPQKAVESYKRAQSIEPDDIAALEALERLYTKTEKWPELLEVYRKKVDLTSEKEAREALYFRMAYLWEEMLQNVDEAIQTYKEVLGQDDGHIKALKALDRLYQVKQAWHELADNLARQLALTDDKPETIDLLVRLADLREKQLSQVAAAIDTYRQVLDLAPENEKASTALERLVHLPEHELSVAGILEPIYKARDQWAKLVDVYEIMVRHALDPSRKIELLHQIGELYEVGGDDGARAFSTYDRALREDPGLKDTQDKLERLARTLDRWADLVALYRSVADGVTDEELQVSLWTRVAQLYEMQLSNNDEAAAAYLKVLSVDPKNLAAANALEAIYLRTDSFTKLVEVVLRKVEMVTEVPEKKDLCFKAAQIFEEVLENADRAIEVFRMVLALDENDGQAIEALERLYIRLERWDQLKDIYAKKAELAPSVDEKKKMYFVLGQVYDRELKDIPRAIETYQTILDLDAEDFQAIQALDRLYGQAGRWYDLLQILEREVELAQSTGETVSLKHRIGQLWEKELKDLTRSVESYREVLSLDGTHEPTLAALDGIVHGGAEPVLAAAVLEPIFETGGEWEKLIDVLEVMVKHAEDVHRRVELLHRIADLYERHLDRATNAFAAYGRALHENSTDEQTIAHLERLAGDTRAWAELVSLYEDELKKLMDPPRQVEMLLRAARVYEEELSQADKAIATFRRVLDVDAEQKTAILALDRLYQAAERFTDLAEILRREIRLAQSDSEIVALQFRLGQVFETQLKDLDNAIEVYREILNADASHGPTLSALELLFAEGQKQLEIAGILEPLYRAAEQWEKLVKIHEVQLARMTDSGERLSMLQRMAELCEHKLVDQPAAFYYWSKALREAPLAELPGEEVERLAQAVHSWDEVVALYSDILAEKSDNDTQRKILLKLARVHEVELRDAARAEESHLRVLGIDNKDPDALAALDRIYTASSMWTELADILGRRIGVTTVTDEIVDLYFRLGRVYADALDEPDHAITSYNSILEVDSRNAKALEALESVYFQRQAWKELYGIYEKMIDIAPGDEAMADCYARMAKIASDALDDRERSIDLWGRVIDLRGEDAIALHNLGDLYERAGAWRELVDILERQIRIATPETQVELYSQLGRIWKEKLGRERSALEAWQKVLEIDAANLPALRASAAIFKETQAWEELVDTLHKLIDIGQTTEMSDHELRELYAELGQLQGDILMRPQEAIDAWKKVLQIDQRDFRALGALEQLFTQEARWEECIEVLERKASVLDDHTAKIDVLLQAASVWEDKIGERGRAADVYERILQVEAGNLTASVQLEQIYRAIGNWAQLVELLLQRVEFLPDAAARIELFQNVAVTYEKQLGDLEGAFVVLQAAFKEDYSNDATSRELERLATSTNKWNELLSDYTQVVQTIQDPKIAADLWVKIGRWYGEHLGHLEYAIASEQQALALDPNHKEALGNLADFYRKTSKFPELVAILAHHAAVETDPKKQVDLYLGMADLYESALMDPAQAVAAYRQAVNADPACLDALSSLERLYRRDQQYPELIDVLSRKAGVVVETETVIQIKQQIGNLYEEHLGDATQAIQSYKEILTVDPQNIAALKALERLYEKTGAMESYLDVLEQQLDVTGTDDERISLYERMAIAWEEQFRKADRAWDALEKILLINDRHEPTLRTLARLYRQERRWSELVETFRKHINAVQDPGTRMDLYLQMGEVYEIELKDLDRAVESYNDILSFDPDHSQALSALGRLYEKIEDWDRAIDTMGRLVSLTDDPRVRVELHHRIGRIHEDYLKDPDTAETRYAEALSIDPGYVPAMASLTSLYQRRGDFLKSAQMMVKSEAFTTNPLEKVKLLYEAGRIYKEKLDDEPRAGELFARVLDIDPEHVDAGEPLADLYFRESTADTGAARWAELEPILDMLVRKADQRKIGNSELNTLYYRLAKTAGELNNVDKALKFYKLAYDLDSTYLPTLLGRAALQYKQEDWDGAFKIYQTILVHHRDSQNESDIVDIFYRLGVIKLKQNERKKALNMFEKALEVDASHRPTLLAVIDLQGQQGDFEAVIHAKRSLLPVADAAESFKLQDEIGDIYREKLKNPQKSIAAYLEALELRPEDHVVLHKVLELYHETSQWKKMIEILVRITDLEKDPLRRGKYFYTAAVIYRDELKALDEAIEFFNKALDCYFEKPDGITPANFQNYLKAFEAIDKICTGKKDWKNQERNYRKMLKRFPQEGHEQIKIALWHALGEIYRSRLREFGAAMSAFEVAVKLEPGNLQRHEILAELYVVAGPDHAQKAVAEHMILIRNNPFRIESYKALRKLYMDVRQYDKAWCMCSALNYLQRADAEELAFYEQYKQKGFVRAKQRLTDEMWVKNLFHPDEDRYIGAIFGAVWQAVALLKSGEHKQFGLKRKEKLDLATHQALFSKVFGYVAQVLNVMLPEVYLRPEQQGGMQLANCKEKGVLVPSLVVGAELLQGRSDKELAFPVARFLTLLRPEHYMKLTLPTNTELRVAFLAALKLVQPNFPIKSGDAAVVDQYAQVMRTTVQPQWLEQLAMVVQRFIQSKGEVDLNKWSQGVDLTAHRVGFVICNDLAMAARFIQMEPTTVGGLQPKDKVKELVMYAISEEYFELRQQIGITIG